MNEDNLQTVQSVNLYFGKKDADLCRWVHSVPRGLFSYLVREAIKSYLNGDSNYRLPVFKTNNKKNTAITKPLSISSDNPEDKQVYDFVTSFDDNMRSYEIKQILRKYLIPSTDVSAEKSINTVSSKTSNQITSATEEKTKTEKNDEKIIKFIKSSKNRSRVK